MTPVTIEITPPDCSWQTANELIEQIKKKNPQEYQLGFVVKDCFRVEKDQQAPEAIYQFNNQNAVVGKNVYMS